MVAELVWLAAAAVATNDVNRTKRGEGKGAKEPITGALSKKCDINAMNAAP